MLCWTSGQTLADEELFLLAGRGFNINIEANEEAILVISWEIFNNMLLPTFIYM